MSPSGRAYDPGAWVTAMVDERSKGLPAIAELEELHDVEELAEDDATGEFSRPQSHAAPARQSVPPPVPKEAREARRPSFAPGSLPPPPPAVGASHTPSSSGMFRIDSAERTLPGHPALGLAELKQELTSLSAELREVRAHNDRLRLTVRLRDDRIAELERALAEQRGLAQTLEQELRGLRERKEPDDLKRVRGIGPGFERALNAIGVTSFQQIAAWTPEDVARIAPLIRALPGRIERERWIEKARELCGLPNASPEQPSE